MVPSAMKTLALPALLLAGAAQALPSLQPREDQPCAVNPTIPEGDSFKAGDKITIQWSAAGLPSGPMKLSIQSNLVTPIITGYHYDIYGELVPTLDFKPGAVFLDPVPIEDEKLEWTVEVIANNTGAEYRYWAMGDYYTRYLDTGDVSQTCDTNYFQVSA